MHHASKLRLEKLRGISKAVSLNSTFNCTHALTIDEAMKQDPASQALDFSRDIYSVSRLNREVHAVLEGSFPLLWVEGEVSNLAQPASGHIYFSLKDSVAKVRCAMFRSRRLLLNFRPTNHQQVLVRARVGFYEGRGDFQLVVEHMEPGGEGGLRLAFDRLKLKLAAEGLFDEGGKRPLPGIPNQVGLITSPTGAAVRDLISVLRRRFAALPVVVYPAQVQGESAVEELVRALEIANARKECDVLIFARGGGSLEDLQAFNDERLARAIRRSEIPVVTGIGHEVDLCIADFAADRRGATPSAAAELVSPSAKHLMQSLLATRQRLSNAQLRILSAGRLQFAGTERQLRLLHPLGRLQRQQQRVDELQRRMEIVLVSRLKSWRGRLEPLSLRMKGASPHADLERRRLVAEALARQLKEVFERALESRSHHLARVLECIEARNPLATLSRGFSILRTMLDGRAVTDAAQVEPGDQVEAVLSRGRLVLKVVDRVTED